MIGRGPLILSYSLPLGGKQEGPHTAGISYAKAKTMRVFWASIRASEDFSEGSVMGEWCRISSHCGWACSGQFHHSRNQPSFLFHCVLVWWWLPLRGMFIPKLAGAVYSRANFVSSGGRVNICRHDLFLSEALEFVFTLTWLTLLWSSVPQSTRAEFPVFHCNQTGWVFEYL